MSLRKFYFNYLIIFTNAIKIIMDVLNFSALFYDGSPEPFSHWLAQY